MYRPRRRSAAFSLLLLVSLAGGCAPSGPERYGVTGTVTYQGQAVQNGSVSFIPEGGLSPTGGAAIVAGRYDVPAASGLAAGKYRVSISVPDAQTDPQEVEMPGVSVEPRETLPAEFNRDTKLRAEVTATGPNQFDFHLE